MTLPNPGCSTQLEIVLITYIDRKILSIGENRKANLKYSMELVVGVVVEEKRQARSYRPD